MGRREEARQRGVLREREHATIDEKSLGVIEGFELAVRCETAVVQAFLAQLRNRVRGGDSSHE